MWIYIKELRTNFPWGSFGGFFFFWPVFFFYTCRAGINYEPMAASCIHAAFGDPGNGGRLRTGLREKETNHSRSGKTVGKIKMEEVWTLIFFYLDCIPHWPRAQIWADESGDNEACREMKCDGSSHRVSSVFAVIWICGSVFLLIKDSSPPQVSLQTGGLSSPASPLMQVFKVGIKPIQQVLLGQ